MLKNAKAFSGFSVDNLANAKIFYGYTLGLEVRDLGELGLEIQFASGGSHFIYPKEDHQPASYTVLNFSVDNIDKTVAALKERGIEFEHYEIRYQKDSLSESEMIRTDEQGIMRSTSPEYGPDMAWFKDPAGNILSILQDKEW
jgi:catechol 2,3-dioxygenase-like lactoylglutathione lyase family enzyme